MSNFQPLEVVGRCSETQLQMVENINYLFLITLLQIDMDIMKNFK